MSIIPTRVVWRGVNGTSDDEAHVLCHVDRLERYCDGLTACRVVIERRTRTSGPDQLCVRIELSVPDGRLDVIREPPAGRTDEALDVAVHEAFATARRRLAAYEQRHRLRTRRHTPRPDGRIVLLFPAEGYGFIETHDIEQLRFDASSLVGVAFSDLAVGMPVLVRRERGPGGPRAAVVRLFQRALKAG